jgi:hypothetical protein
MSVYESISRASLKAKRRLFDFNVSILGQEMKAVRISFTEDIYQDVRIEDSISDSILDAIIRFPAEMPLERYRLGFQSEVTETRTYFYEILPIEAYTKLEDHIEKNDFLFFFLEDEKNNKIPYLFQVTDSFGKFEIGLVWKKQYLAPYHGKLTNKIIKYLEEYVIHDAYDSYKEENSDLNYLVSKEESDEYISESYTNMLHNSLNPTDFSVTLDSGTYVAQCAFGSFSFLEYSVTPTTPVRFTLSKETEISIDFSDDCQFPSIYNSYYFHPYVFDKREEYYIQRYLTPGVLNFELHTEFTDNYKYGFLLALTDDYEYQEGYVPVVTDFDEEEFRPLFYTEDATGNYVEFKMKSFKELVLTQKVGTETTIESFGIPEFSIIPFSISISETEISVLCQERTILLDTLFLNKEIYIGYEPERYLNDFISQIYM